MSRTIYEDDFDQDIITLLSKYKYWVFAYEVKEPPKIQQYQNAIRKRFIITNEGLQITCFKDDKDYSNTNLNPRAELRLENYKLPINKQYKVTFIMKLPFSNSGFEFFQIMVLSKPVLQLEIRKQKFCARYHDGRNLISVPFHDEIIKKDIKWEVEYKLDSKNGYYKVYKDDRLIWSKTGQNIFNPSSKTNWFQYGVYKNGSGHKNDHSVIYKHLKIEEVFQKSSNRTVTHIDWKPQGCLIEPMYRITQRKGKWAGPQLRLEPNMKYKFQCDIYSKYPIWVTMRTSIDGKNWKYKRISDTYDETQQIDITIQTENDIYHIIYLEGSPVDSDFYCSQPMISYINE